MIHKVQTWLSVPSPIVPNQHHRVLQSSKVDNGYRSGLLNFQNVIYYSTIYVGTPAQKLLVVMDTGSDWLVLESKQCKNCLNNTYDSTLSKTHKRVDYDYVEHVYGTYLLHGYDATDLVALDADNQTVINFEFFEIYEQAGIQSEFDGIFGLSRKLKGKTGPLFLEGLFNDTKISKQLFAFYLTGSTRLNYVDIGHYDLTAMKNANDLVWLPVQDTSLYWWQYIEAIRFGETEEDFGGVATAFTLTKPLPAIFDTGSAFVSFPRALAVDIIGRMV